MSEKRDIKLYILDILQAMDEINEFVVNFSNGDELANNKIVYKAVLMNFIIMGEAARNLYEEVRVNHPEIEWKDIMDMRNKLVHEYFGVDNRVVWDAIKNNFPELKKILERIRESLK
jgi:uncharacterized protein with HEPN domain